MSRRLRGAAVFERGEKLFPKISKKPLALFCSWGIFLPVAGNDRDDNNRRPLSSGKSKAKTKIKIFQKSS
jgi:hypothetical protein